MGALTLGATLLLVLLPAGGSPAASAPSGPAYGSGIGGTAVHPLDVARGLAGASPHRVPPVGGPLLSSAAGSVALVATIDLPNGTNPVHPGYDPRHGLIQIPDFGTNQLTVVSDTNNSVVAVRGTGDDPFSVTYNPVNGYSYVMNLGFTANVSVYNGSVGVTSIPTGANPHFGVYDPLHDYVYEGNTGTGNVSVIRNTTVVANLDTGPSPFDLAYDPGHGYVYVTNFGGTTITVLNATSVVQNITVGASPYWATYDPSNGYVYVTDSAAGNVTVMNGTTIVATIPVGSSPYASTYDSADGFVYVPNDLSGTVSILNGTTVVATVPVGSNPVFASYDSASGLVDVVNYGSSNVSVLDGLSVVASVNVGTLPKSAVYDTANGCTYVANDATDNVSVIGHTVSPYAVTFTETGLPSGTPWGIRVGATTYTSAQPSLSVVEPNGTYAYFVPPVTNFTTSPGSGNVTVLGNNPSVPVTFVRTYPVTFVQSGLPAGTTWSVQLGSTPASSTNATVEFAEPNGSYAYSITPIAGYSTSWSGTVDVTGAPRSVPVVFTHVTYALTFAESGLPSGTNWSVTIRSSAYSSTLSSIVVPEPNGTYLWTLGPIAGYSTTWSGSAVVAGVGTTVPVAFVRVTYAVTFTESGLPAGTTWSVRIGSTSNSSTGSSVALPEPNGTFTYVIDPLPGYTTRWSGSILVNASGVDVAVTFAETVYAIVFTETGLPTGTNWSVRLSTETVSSTTATVTFLEPNGTYAYSIGPPTGYAAAGPGNLSVTGTNLSVPVSMAKTFAVGFTQSGLPPGTVWSVRVGNTTVVGTLPTHVFAEPNGSYPYSVGAIPGFQTAWHGTVVVRGATEVPVVFSLVNFTVQFSETGLPAGTNWSVTLGNTTESSTTASLVFSVPNGSYAYIPEPVAGFSLPAPGSVVVNGSAPATIPLAFAPEAAGPTFLGLPALEGYALLGGGIVVAVVVALLLVRRRRPAADEGRAGEEPPPPTDEYGG